MGKLSKFKLKNGKSTGYSVVYHVIDEGWSVIRGLTMLEAKDIMNMITQWAEVEDAAILHVEDSWQRSFFDEEV